jgi:hypothetical protein
MAKYAQPILFFYCYICKDYEPKTSPHYTAQQARFAERGEAEKAKEQKLKKRKKS